MSRNTLMIRIVVSALVAMALLAAYPPAGIGPDPEPDDHRRQLRRLLLPRLREGLPRAVRSGNGHQRSTSRTTTEGWRRYARRWTWEMCNWDVDDMNVAELVRGCDEGLLVPISIDDFSPGADGMPAVDDFVEGTISECGVTTLFFSTVFRVQRRTHRRREACHRQRLLRPGKVPGPPGHASSSRGFNLEFALMADGVPLDQVYATLDTEEGIARAFRKLNTIKEHIIWWETGAHPPQLLADGEVVMTTAYNGRIIQRPGAGGSAFCHRLGRPGPGYERVRHRRRHAQTLNPRSDFSTSPPRRSPWPASPGTSPTARRAVPPCR